MILSFWKIVNKNSPSTKNLKNRQTPHNGLQNALEKRKKIQKNSVRASQK